MQKLKHSGSAIRSRVATVKWNIVFSFISIALAFVTGVLLVPLYLRNIPTEMYGVWLATGNVILWLGMLDPGLSIVVQQRVALAYGADKKESISTSITSSLIVGFGISCLVFIAGILCTYFLDDLLNLPQSIDVHSLKNAFLWSAAGASLMVFSFTMTAINQGLQSSFGTGLIYVSASAIRIILVVYCVRAGMGVIGIAMPTAVMGFLLVLGNGLYMLHRLISEKIFLIWSVIELRSLAKVLSFASLGRGAVIVVNNIDLFIVARTIGPESVSILRLTRTPPELSRMLLERPFVSLQPSLTHLLGDEGSHRAGALLGTMFRAYVVFLVMFSAIFIAFNRDIIQLWVGAEFYGGATLNAILIAAFGLTTSASIMSGICYASGCVKQASLSSAAQAVLYFPLILLGAHLFGTIGVVAASAISVVLTQGWYLPRELWRFYGRENFSILGFLTLAGKASVVGASFVIVYKIVPVASWLSLLINVMLFSAAYLVSIYMWSHQIREDVRHALVLFRKRRS